MKKSIIKVILVAIPLLAAVPAMAQFQSTSTMTGSGSAYASDPTLGADGAATYSSISHRGRTEGEGNTDPTDVPIVPPSQEEVEKTSEELGAPLGPAVPALLLLAGVYAGVVAVRRRQQA